MPKASKRGRKINMNRAPSVKLVRAVAKKVVADQLEDKYARAEPQPGGQPVSFNSGVSSPSDCYALMPTVTGGDKSNERIGDKIRPKALVVQGYITANGDYQTSMLNSVRLWMLEDKGIRNWQNSGSLTVGQDLLDQGGQKVGYTGLPNQETIRTNKDRYKVFHDKVYTMAKGTGMTANVGGINGTQTFVSTQQYIKFRVRIPTPAVLHYNDIASLYPTNFAPFICLGYSQPDFDAQPDSGVLKVNMTYSAHLDYEDS